MSSSESDAARNRELWTKSNAEHTGERARGAWAAEEITWGIWHVPEADVQVLPAVEGKDVVELGCGTAYVSAWLARRGARPVGVDITPAQLDTARAMQQEFALEFPVIEADAAETGLPDASADLVISEYGASIWADPYLWIPEAARLARPGARLIFLRNSTLQLLCMDMAGVVEHLVRPQRGLNRVDWDDTAEVEFHLPHGELFDLLRANGFSVERLLELYAPEGAETHEHYNYVTAEWASKWPSEEIWVARKHDG
jgi:SAM-dependent methyltransferase